MLVTQLVTTVLYQEENTPRFLMTINSTVECTMGPICLPPFPVSCPGAIHCRTACFYYACFVPMRRAARSGSSDSYPCPYRHYAGKMQGKINTLATRALSRLCRRNSICMVMHLAVHVADEYKVACAGSFHARLHMRLLRRGAILSALPHDAPRSATQKREYCMSDAWVLVDDTLSQEENSLPQLVYSQQAGSAAFDIIYPRV